MSAKRFFYVAAGILMLVIAFGIVTQSVIAQDEADAIIVDMASDASLAIDSLGRIYNHDGMWRYFLQAPGPVTPVAISGGGCPIIAMSDGRTYKWVANSCVTNGYWEDYGNIFGTVASVPEIPTTGKSWSTVKQGYKR